MALSLIAEIMGWADDTQSEATREYAWLRLMSTVKYDSYSDFRAGIRFVESLATWLKQFDPEDRKTAFRFIRERLVYISIAEMQRLIEAFVPEILTPNLRKLVGQELGVPAYQVWATKQGADTFRKRRRKTLFVGMSDGSRIDVLRRANAGLLSQEQVVPMLNVDNEKWRDLAKKLEGDNGMRPGEKFDSVYLIDDFTASGTTFIRQVDGKWKGKLQKFNDIIVASKAELKDKFPIADNFDLHIHHYISSAQAKENLLERLKAAEAWQQRTYGTWSISEGLLLPTTLPLSSTTDDDMIRLCEKYYDHQLFERLRVHCEENGQTTMAFGYANCALPIVLEHNTPNNSIPVLWADTDGAGGAHPMRSLFHRRDRHG
jgi:hypothetical protein